MKYQLFDNNNQGAEIFTMDNKQVVFKAIDRSRGCSVAWIECGLFSTKAEERSKEAKKLIARFELLSKLENPYIMPLVEAWPYNGGDCVIAIGEIMCSTLKLYSNSASD